MGVVHAGSMCTKYAIYTKINLLDRVISEGIDGQQTDMWRDFPVDHVDLFRGGHLNCLLYKTAPLGMNTAYMHAVRNN